MGKAILPRRAIMILDSRINKPENYRPHGHSIGNAVAMTWLIAAAMLFLCCCQSKPVMPHARFVHLPSSGWLQSEPLTFSPEYDDSTLTYSLALAVRHGNSYRYSNLSLVVDMIAVDSTVNRRVVNMPLADEYGNWKGGGFGALYQDTVSIAGVIAPEDARSIVVWQAMEGCDTLRGLVDIGVFVKPL